MNHSPRRKTSATLHNKNARVLRIAAEYRNAARALAKAFDSHAIDAMNFRILAI